MPDLSAVRKGVSSLTLGVAILALIALLCVIASVLFATRFVEETIGYVVNNIANLSGRSVYLVRAVVIFATMPFFWAVGKFTKNIWGLINLGWNSMSFYKNWYGRIIVAYVGVYFLVMYWASAHALNYKYCADTPEGIWTSDASGKDPIYGIDLKPCTMDQKLKVREMEGHVRPPNELSIADAATYKWFDPVVPKHPLVWYSALPDNEYRFFDGRGIDPHNGQELNPVTPEIVERVKQQQIAKAQAKKQADDEAAEQQEREKEARESADQVNARVATIDALVDQAQSAFKARDYESALAGCKKVLKASRGNETCETIEQHASIKLAEKLVNEGQAHFERKEFDEALWSAEQALTIDPNNVYAAKLKQLSSQMRQTSH